MRRGSGRPAKERIIRRVRPLRAIRRTWLCVAFGILAPVGVAWPDPVVAQRPFPPSRVADVTGSAVPPVPIAGLDAEPTVPLEFSHAWLGKAAEVRRRRAELAAAGKLAGMTPEALAREGAALTGVLRVPVIPVVYSGTEPPFDYRMLAQRLFGGARGDTLSYLEYWREVSGGLLEVTGAVAPWITLPSEASYYLAEDEYGWARFGRIVEFREQAVHAADQALDFGRFDNDGPDGIPNSGDDDGFVDFAAMVYALPCGADWRAGAIWPHRGAMPPFETNDRSANGGRIEFTDYVILPAIEPGTCTPLHIGVLAHETGHALGLPDLYDYDGSSRGVGAWGLMGMGAHSERWSPAHLSAWAKEQLGWVRVEQLTGDVEALEIPPVERARVVFRYDIPGRSGEYLLFENRQHIGSDVGLPGTGLLAWRVNPDRGELGNWNADELRRAVGLLEADGRADLVHGGAADAGDPFPGESGRRDLELDGAGRFRLSSIEQRGDVIAADVSIGFDEPAFVAMPNVVRLAAPEGAAAVEQIVRVRPEGGAPTAWGIHPGAPAWLDVFERGGELVVRADPGGLEPGDYEATIALAPAGPIERPTTSHAGPAEVPAKGSPNTTSDASRAAAPVAEGLLGRPVNTRAAPQPSAPEQDDAQRDDARRPAARGDGLLGRPTTIPPEAKPAAPRSTGVEPAPARATTAAAQPARPDERLVGTLVKASPARSSGDDGLAGSPLGDELAGVAIRHQSVAVLGTAPAIGHITVRFNVAAPGVPEVIATGLPWSWGLAARNGRLYQAGYGWDPLALRPRPRVLSLRDGQRYASTLARVPADALYAPAPTDDGGTYVLARARGENYLYRVDADGSAAVVASRLGDGPAYGVALAPGGDILVADWTGRIRRVAPEGRVTSWGTVGAYTYQIATDAAGTLFAATYQGDVVRIDRHGRRTILSTGFEPGRLVSIAVTASGAVFAAERGGEGRVVRIAPNGSRKVVTRVAGAEFYGLALDRGFLYALDLGHRQLLRLTVGRRDAPPAVAAR